jgi:hypothetical protein
MNESPFTFAEARAAAHQASQRQLDAEQTRAAAVETHAEATRAYRVAVSRKIVELHAGGVAWTVAGDVARGDKAVADLQYDMNVAAGMKEIAEQAAFRLGSDRRSVETLITWSMRRELAEGGAS